MVDAGDDEVRPPRQDARAGVERDVDAIGGRPVEREDAGLDRAQPHRPVQAQRVARRALLRLGREHDDLGAGAQESAAHRADPGARVPVVVRQKDEGSRHGGPKT